MPVRSLPTLLFVLVLGLVFPCLAVEATPKPPAPKPRRGRETKVLVEGWRFLADVEKSDEKKDWVSSVPTEAKTIAVPALWSKQEMPTEQGTGWYWCEFLAPDSWKGQTVRLRFEAVAERAEVWLNSQRLGEHHEGVTPFEFNVTKSLHVGKKNLLAVKVEGRVKAGAGMWQGVLLMVHDEAYLSDCFPQTNVSGRLTAVLALDNTSANTGDSLLEARLVSALEPTKELKKTQQILHITPNRNLTTLLTSLRGKALHLWSPNTPHLYHLQLVFRQERDILDTQETTFGFREFGYKDGNLLLNEEPLRLVSIAPRPERPLVIATTSDMQKLREMLRRLKERGVTVLHLDAPPPILLTLADEEGMLVVEGGTEGQSQQTTSTLLRDLVLRDRAHPCLLAWNLGNVDLPFAQSIRQLDPTRFLIVGSPTSRQLWLPNQNESSAVPLPAGLMEN